MTDAPEIKTKKRGGWGRALLFVSLAANLLVVGVIAGAIIRHDRFDGPMDGHRPTALQDLGFGLYGRALSPSDRREITRTFQEHGPELIANRKQARDQVKTLLGALRADPFDLTSVRTIAAQQHSMLFERHALGQRILIGRIKAMNGQERAAFADRLERLLHRGPVRDTGKP